MSKAKTGIEWTDRTWNPTVGCERVSPGCARCYAKQLHDQRYQARRAGHPMPAQYGEPFETVQLKPERLDAPLRWRDPQRIFVDSVSDLLHEAVPDAFLDRVFATMARARWHTFQVLTKRPERMRDYCYGLRARAGTEAGAAGLLSAAFPGAAVSQAEARAVARAFAGAGLPNVWLGVSAENQRFARARIPLLCETPAAVRFVSFEPLLGAIDLADAMGSAAGGVPGLDWAIVGGESGPDARPLELAWARALRDQCRERGVAFMFKQVGGRTAKSGGRLLDGRTWDEYPVAHPNAGTTSAHAGMRGCAPDGERA